MIASAQKLLPFVLVALAMSGAAGGQSQDQSGSAPSAQTQVHSDSPERLSVSAGITSGLVIKKVQPLYPEKARKKHIQGIVTLDAEISKEGDVTHLSVVSGDPLLAQAAMDAVKQWKYRPFLRNGQPMDVETKIQVAFTLTTN